MRNKIVESSKKTKASKIPRKKKILLTIELLLIFLAVLVLFLLFQFGFIKNPIKKINLEPEFFDIKDNCAMIVGQLIHTIDNEVTCELVCKTNCETREMKFYSSEFTEKENDCNGCACFCK